MKHFMKFGQIMCVRGLKWPGPASKPVPDPTRGPGRRKIMSFPMSLARLAKVKWVSFLTGGSKGKKGKTNNIAD